MAAEKKVVLLMGNTGVGKSSVGCRLLGFEPASEGEKPFKVESTGKSVTLDVDTKDGTWFGNLEEPALRVVDTPGLGDARGTAQDNENIVKVGTYLDNNPVHCILLVCQAACPRVDNNTKGLLNILATKIAPKDYAKLGVIVNVYSHHDLARQQRSYNSQPRGQSEAEIQAGMKQEFAGSLREFAKDGKLTLSEKHITTLVSHTFFVDSHYTPFTNPMDNHEAFVTLSLWARTCGEIDREGLTPDMAPVNKELQTAVDDKQKAENLLTENNAKYLEEKEAVKMQKEKEIAEIKAENERHAKQIEREFEEAHKQAMKLEGEKRDALMKQINESHRKDQENMRMVAEAKLAAAQEKADRADDRLREANAAHQAEQTKKVENLERKVAELQNRPPPPPPPPRPCVIC